jgi:YcaO-like protein with predicted kinase domain
VRGGDVAHHRRLSRVFSAQSTLAPKGHFATTHRTLAPAETVERVCPLMGAMGITRIATVTGLDRIGVPVVMVTRPNSRMLAVSQGKGADLPAAQASGLMESVESYHAERVIRPQIIGCYNELRASDRIVDVDRLPQSTDTTFDRTATMAWIEGYDVLKDEPVLVPYDVVHTDFRVSQAPSSCLTRSSNGLAAGNHLLEAVSHALCEVLERDATTLANLEDDETRNSLLVDTRTVTDPVCRFVLDAFESADIAVAVWDVTSDIGLPAFSCLIADDPTRARYRLPIGGGAGCHPSRDIALLRALTEAAQSRLTFVAGSRDDMPRADYQRFAEDQPLRRMILKLSRAGRRDVHGTPNYPAETLDDDVRLELRLLLSAGIEHVIVVDLTHPRIGIPVIRVVVPGLEGALHSRNYRLGRRSAAVLHAGLRRALSESHA